MEHLPETVRGHRRPVDESLRMVAVAAAQEHHPDLILLDVVLPKKNGYQVCRQLKGSPDTAGSKIVMVSSKSQETDRFWGMKQGADDYVTKPIDAAVMLAAIERAMKDH